MDDSDLNLLVALDALLAENSVARAAERLGLSGSAMSRTLSRLRIARGDPLLVRAGRGLVPTPRADELRDRVARLAEGAREVLRPASPLDPARLEATYTLRTSDGFVENFGSRLLAQASRSAPGVRLRFVPKLDRSTAGLRDGSVDLGHRRRRRSDGPGGACAGAVSRPLREASSAAGIRSRESRSRPSATPRRTTSSARADETTAGRSTRR